MIEEKLVDVVPRRKCGYTVLVADPRFAIVDVDHGLFDSIESTVLHGGRGEDGPCLLVTVAKLECYLESKEAELELERFFFGEDEGGGEGGGACRCERWREERLGALGA